LVWNNTVYPDGGSHCLLSYWSNQVLGALNNYSTLPVISRTHDQLGQVWLDREARDACGFSGMIKFDNATRAAVGITASSTGSCVFGVSGAQASGANVLSYETYGPEATTWFSIFFLLFLYFFIIIIFSSFSPLCNFISMTNLKKWLTIPISTSTSKPQSAASKHYIKFFF
jgi:hypothetical protein